jgi:DNA-binding NarL/FixJ family response regulator
MDSVMVAGTVENAQSMIAMTAMAKADLAIIELDCGGTLEGLSVARAIGANSPATAILIYTPALNPRAFKAL